jgi:hypothetical protein
VQLTKKNRSSQQPAGTQTATTKNSPQQPAAVRHLGTNAVEGLLDGVLLHVEQAVASLQVEQGPGTSKKDSGSAFFCGVCDQSFTTAEGLQHHKNGARHKVNLLNEQLKSSGSFHANLQGLQVSEFEQVESLQVSSWGVQGVCALAYAESHNRNEGTSVPDVGGVQQTTAGPVSW